MVWCCLYLMKWCNIQAEGMARVRGWGWTFFVAGVVGSGCSLFPRVGGIGDLLKKVARVHCVVKRGLVLWGVV